MDPDLLRRLARSRGGVFTTADAAQAGFTRREAEYCLRRGAWVRLERGVHVDAEALTRASATERHRLLVAARLQVRGGPSVVASHGSAAAVLGVDLGLPIPDEPVLTAPRVAGPRSVARGVRIAALPSDEVLSVRGVRSTALARTVVDVARESELRSAVIALGAGFRAGAWPEDVSEVLGRQRGWPGAARATAALATTVPGTETALEDLSLWALQVLGLPPPRVQVELRTRSGSFLGRVDFLWLAQRVVGEADGRGKYDRPEVLWAEKRREDRLRDAGFEVVRWSWHDAWGPSPELGARVRAAFARAERRAA